MIARAAEGGMRDAWSIMDMCLGYAQEDGAGLTEELVLRVRNILNRTQNAAAQLMVRRGDILLDKNSLRASLKGEILDLTTTEFKLLAYLMEREGKLQDRYELQKELFGYADTTQSRALDTHIKRLRQKLGNYAACICTERGVGYYFESKSEQA